MTHTNHTVGNERKADSTQEMIESPAEKNSAGDLTKKYYLENSPEYIGKVNSVRFASVENVKDWPRQFEAKCFQCQPRLSEKPVQAFCLDFEAVEAAYGISLYSDYMAFDLAHNS